MMFSLKNSYQVGFLERPEEQQEAGVSTMEDLLQL